LGVNLLLLIGLIFLGAIIAGIIIVFSSTEKKTTIISKSTSVSTTTGKFIEKNNFSSMYIQYD
jgi:hypothetical protein